MNKVAKAQLKPHHCAVNPHLGFEPRGGFYDTGQDLQGPGMHIHRVYIAVSTVEDLARREGWCSPAEFDAMVEENRLLAAQLADVTEENDRLDAIVDSIDVLESAAFKARKRAGRMPKEKTAA